MDDVRVRETVLIQVPGFEVRPGAVFAVIADMGGLAVPVFLDHQGGGCLRVSTGVNVHSLSAKLSHHQAAEIVIADPADPRRSRPESGGCYRDIRFRPTDGERWDRAGSEQAVVG